jgi:hypothetical protein
MACADPAPIAEAMRLLAVAIAHLARAASHDVDAGTSDTNAIAEEAGSAAKECSLEAVLDDSFLLNQVRKALRRGDLE